MCKILTVILWVLLDYKKFSWPVDMVYYIHCSSDNAKRLALHA